MDGICFNWVQHIVIENRLADLVTLEVGSYDVNGSVRPLFSDCFGVDERDGPGVDLVADGCHLPFDDAAYQVAVSTETLEHVKRPWLFVSELARVIGRGGWVILTTCDYDFGRHDFPGDYWRFSPLGLSFLFTDAGLTITDSVCLDGSRLFYCGRKL